MNCNFLLYNYYTFNGFIGQPFYLLSKYNAGAQGRIWTDGFTGLQSVPLGHSGTCALFGSPSWDRTRDQQINSLLLYRWANGELKLERDKRIELSSSAWKAGVIPLYESRTGLANLQGIEPRSAVLETDVMPLYQRLNYGAGYRVRTDDILVGNETFYHWINPA